MEIVYFEKLDSTHKFLLRKVKKEEIKTPFVIIANEQDSAIGSGKNRWISIKGNLFVSFVLKKDEISKDVKLQSLSIYFAYLLKEILEKKGSSVWLKWPNDFYIKDKKIGGFLVSIVGENIVASFGLNTKKAPKNFEILDIDIDKIQIIKELILKIKSKKSWIAIFKKYKVEFEKSKNFFTKVGDKKESLKGAILNEDGSITIKNKRVLSVR